MIHFTDELARAARKRGNPVVVGLDPRWENLPEGLADLAVGRDSSSAAGADRYALRALAYKQFCCEIIDVIAPLVPAVKPQSAFFEELGPHGMQALAAVMAHARQQGLLVILDAKRGDIGSTAEAYARGILGRDRECLGSGRSYRESRTLEMRACIPLSEWRSDRGAGLFVLVKTSNPGGGMFQDLVVSGMASGGPCSGWFVGEWITAWGRDGQRRDTLSPRCQPGGKSGGPDPRRLWLRGRWGCGRELLILSNWPSCARICLKPGFSYPVSVARAGLPRMWRQRLMAAAWERLSTVHAASFLPTSGPNMPNASVPRAGRKRWKPPRGK